MDWRLDTASTCPEFTGGCIKYPISKLQKQDTALGLNFYVTMYVYNVAGHFVIARTPEFTIPSSYPPSHAVIIDLDPVDVDSGNKDIDAHFTLNTVCAKWYGFNHHENITMRFGVGTVKGLDNIINFKTISDTNVHCFVSSAIPESLHVFVSLRATSSGGSTISSSDGIMIYNSSRVLEQLIIYDGPICFVPSHLVSTRNHSMEEYFVFAEPLHTGKTYTLRILGDALAENEVFVQSQDIHVKNIFFGHNQHDIIFEPFTENPLFSFSESINGGISTLLYNCEDDLSATTVNNFILAHWRGISDQFTFETAVVKLHCLDTSDDDCIDYQSPFSSTNGKTWSEHDVSLQTYETYYVAVKPCLNSVCLKSKLSSGVVIEPESPIIDIMQSEIELASSNCSRVRIIWQRFTYINVPVYQWSIATVIGMTAQTSAIVQWRNALSIQMYTDHIQVKS